MRVGYFGTPEHSRKLLQILYDSGIEIAFVVTNPDKPQGRSKTPVPSPVKQFAMGKKIRIFQPSRLKDAPEREEILKIPVDIHIVYAYGQIIPEDIYTKPPLGSINLHGSLLPEYRGASPVQSALMDGKKETGFSIQRLAQEVDSGEILDSEKISIHDDDTTETILERITQKGGERIVSFLKSGSLPPGIPQDPTRATYCKKISPEDRILDFSKPSRKIHDKVRALYPNPVAYTMFRGKRVLIYKTSLPGSLELTNISKYSEPGTLVPFAKKLLFVICGDKKMLSIEELQLEGRNRMKAVDFLNGYSVKEGEIFS